MPRLLEGLLEDVAGSRCAEKRSALTAKLSVALQMLKQNVARRLRSPEGGLLWQPRYYDFNVWSAAKRIEKLRYIHRNPVKRGWCSVLTIGSGAVFAIMFQDLKEW